MRARWIATVGNLMNTLLFMTIVSSPALSEEDVFHKNDPGVFRRKTPSGQYADPSSFFRFHGYVSLSLSEAGDELGNESNATPQILVPGISPRTGRNESGFRNDAALFIGGEPFEGVSSVIEIHFVGDATDPVITEAKIVWDLVGRDGGSFTLRTVAGRYWWPFGIHNSEWFSALNRFSLLSPAAAEVVPAHYNEVGIMVEGEATIEERTGINYVVSVGNGVPGFDLMPNVRGTPMDENSNRTLTGRLGVVHRGLNLDLEVGVSAASGDLRTGINEAMDLSNPLRYQADFVAYGPDLTLSAGAFALRSYYYMSQERFDHADVDEIERDGFTLEPSWSIPVTSSAAKSVTILVRYSKANEQRLSATEASTAAGTATVAVEDLQRLQYGVAVNVEVTSTLTLKLSYIEQEEKEHLVPLDNSVITFSITVGF